MRSNLISSHRGRGQVYLTPQLKNKKMDSEGFSSFIFCFSSIFSFSFSVHKVAHSINKTTHPVLRVVTLLQGSCKQEVEHWFLPSTSL